MEFQVGAGQMIPGFDRAVLGMELGEQKTVTIPCAEAYGPRREDMLLEVPLAQFPPDVTPEVGKQLYMRMGSGQVVPVTISSVSESSATLDANHMLAGKDLTFEITLVAID